MAESEEAVEKKIVAKAAGANSFKRPKPTAEERDSLHIMPLSMLPLNTPGLLRARLVKNNRLETMVEMFKDDGVGSGQVTLSDLPDYFEDGETDPFKEDLVKLSTLARAPSFDVYSARIAMRSLGIEVHNSEYLSLSSKKRAELAERMRTFTRPLLLNVYAGEEVQVSDDADVSSLLRNPDKKEAFKRLSKLADTLRVDVNEIPRFIEDYGDVFLSLAYFQDILDGVVPIMDQFLDWAEELLSAWHLRDDRARARMIKRVIAELSDISGSITGRFESFDRKTQNFWDDISAERFHEVRKLITSHHTTVGGVLCGLTLKMDHWKRRFPDSDTGGPQQRIEFIFSEIIPGLDHIAALEKKAAKS